MTPATHSVFVVDDDGAVRDSLKTLLELQSFKVETFETCHQLLSANTSNVYCLVLDIHLPNMSGFELMEALRRANRALPTILITARSDNAVRARATALGAVAVLEKPIEFNGLMSAIKRCAEQARI